jgi:hypothetical protein
MSAVVKHRMFIILKIGIVPASAFKLKVISVHVTLLLEVSIFNDRLLARLIVVVVVVVATVVVVVVVVVVVEILCDCE